jgi:DNA-binding helix-hairpin-helix protein with protein kinase domain
MPPQDKAKPILFDAGGRPLSLGAVLGKGGEGAVYELIDRPELVAKLYNNPVGTDKALKIAAMPSLGNERLLKLAAWPTEPIRAGSSSGAVAGFAMPKFSGRKAAFNLYSPKLRLQEFPTAGWPFLIRAAANAARAFAVVHENGHVIGDVNHGNLFVGNDATVRLIDCDSYQVTLNRTRWFCEVGVATHQPPEFQSLSSYKGIVRTPNHDNFGLAVIIFQMLFMAYHPFAGRYLGTGEMPMERAIREYRFAYGVNANAMQMRPPAFSLRLNRVTKEVGLLFERAFSKRGSQPDGRPRPREWADALHDLEKHLKSCAANPGHQFLDSLTKCPWCEVEAIGGFALFPVVLTGATNTGFSITALWQRIMSVPNPDPAPPLPRVEDHQVSPSATVTAARETTWGKIAAWFGAGTSLRAELRKELASAEIRWKAIQDRWAAEVRRSTYGEKRAALQTLRELYDRLPQERLRRLEALEANRRQAQLQAFLDRCRIDRARIRGIGDTKKATLQSYGIETAADIVGHKVLAVPGFGPVFLKRLQGWRAGQERRFVFDPSKSVDQASKIEVERQILAMKTDLERKLLEGAAQLSALSQQMLTRRKLVLTEAERASRDLAQAQINLKAL